jgi:nucleoside-triphosphatase THEP1
MECFSRRFQRLVKKILDSDRMLVATIAQRGGGLIAEIKSREDARIYILTKQNRDRMVETILSQVNG